MDILQTLSRELNIRPSQAEAAVELLDAGNTVPFIARYRKEMTGSLDDEQLRTLEERLRYLRAFETRRTEIETAIREQGNLTDEIRDALSKATILAELEDLYRPFRPKRKTRATMAAARGLTPLAERLLEQRAQDDPEALAHAFLSDEVPDTAAALSGARDILAERVSDDAALRARLRELCFSRGSIRAEGQKGVEDTPYATYADFSEGVRRMAGHRVLALDRGEREGFLKVSLLVDEPAALSLCESAFVRGSSPASAQVRAAADDAYSRLIFPSLEREVRASLTEKACAAAIEVFGANLKSYLMTPPLPGRVVLGLDPAYRTGCKIAVVDPTGAVLDVAVVYPTPPQNRKAEAAEKLLSLPDVELNGSRERSIPYVLNVSFVGIRSEIMLNALSEDLVFVSAGSACAKGTGKANAALRAQGAAHADNAIRFSFSRDTTAEELSKAYEIIIKKLEYLR